MENGKLQKGDYPRKNLKILRDEPWGSGLDYLQDLGSFLGVPPQSILGLGTVETDHE